MRLSLFLHSLGEALAMAIGPTLLAFVMAFMAIRVLAPIAPRLGLVDHPGGRKHHEAVTPLVGGLGVIIGALPALFVIRDGSEATLALALSAALLVVVGVADDRLNLSWPIRVAFQAAAALILIYVGGVKVELIGPVFGLQATSLGSLSVPFTVLATIGLINALNMCDGIDGLAGSVSVCALAMIGAAAAYAGATGLAAGLFILAGAVIGFLMFNLRTPWRGRAAVFLGNPGSEFLGLVMAWASFRLTQDESHPVSPVLAPFLIAPPVIDCLALLIRRGLARRSPFSADRGHAHHILLDAGLSPTGVVAAVCALALLLGAIAAAARLMKVPDPLFLVAYLFMLAIWLFATRKPEALSAKIRSALRSMNALNDPARRNSREIIDQ